MKQILILLAFALVFGRGYSQNVDSLQAVKIVDSLISLAKERMIAGNFQEAVSIGQQAVDFSKDKWGEDNVWYAASVNRLGSIYAVGKQFEKAEALYIKAIELRRKILGKEDPDYARSLYNLACLYDGKGLYVKAEPLYLESEEIREKVLGKEHPDCIESMIKLANMYRARGNYAKSEPLFLETISIQAKTLGKNTRDYATTLNYMGVLYNAKGIMSRAEQTYLESLGIREKVLGKDNPDYAQSLKNLAILYYNMGEYTKSEQRYLEADEICTKTMGEKDPAVLNGLAILYKNKGDYEKAELLYLEAIAIRAKKVGKDHPEYATSLNNLAALYRARGDYAKAEPLYLESKDIWAKTYGKEHPRYAMSLNNLANLYYVQGDYNKAETLYLESKEIRGKILGKDHIDYAQTVSNLASLYMNKHDYVKADSLFLESATIWAKVVGKEHPEYAKVLGSLSGMYIEEGDYPKSEPLLLESKRIFEKVLGKENPEYSGALTDLAILYLATDRTQEATTLFLELNDLVRRLIEKASAYSSENQMLGYLSTFDRPTAQFQSFIHVHPSPELIGANFDNALFSKGAVLENTHRLANAISSVDSLTRNAYENWQRCRRRLALEYAKPIAERKYVAEVEDEAEGYEKTLTRNLPSFSEARRVPHWQEVQRALQPGEAAIEFVHFNYFNPKPTDSTHYAALLLRPGWPAPRMVYLCEQRPLDSLLRAPDPADAAARLYATRGIDPTNGKVPPVYNLIWRPLDSLLQGVKTVYYSPSGLLHKVAFNAIPTGKGKEVLSDRYRLFQVFSTRNLVIQPGSSSDTKPHSSALFGGIQYDAQWTSDSTAVDSMTYTSLATRLIPERRGSYGHGWGYLPGTRTEVEKVQQLLARNNISCTLRSDTTATEEYFKTLGTKTPSPDVLHVATHGFFFPEAAQKATRNWDEAGSNFKLSDHPLLRSGLLLAGANKAWSEGRPFPGREDGILTAYELSQMNLTGTKLAVLSACETGLGDIQNNEGVFGLQRALKMAGVEKIIVSLWQVPDRETSDFMQTFYGKWLGGLTVREAFYQTQGLMRRKYKEAFRWAGFVLVE